MSSNFFVKENVFRLPLKLFNLKFSPQDFSATLVFKKFFLGQTMLLKRQKKNDKIFF